MRLRKQKHTKECAKMSTGLKKKNTAEGIWTATALIWVLDNEVASLFPHSILTKRPRKDSP